MVFGYAGLPGRATSSDDDEDDGDDQQEEMADA
jgi:hypothetical protein